MDIEISEIEEIKDGSDTLFCVKTAKENLIAKFRTYSSLEKSWFEKEPLMLEKISGKTSLPVPNVNFYRISYEKPFFVMNELPGVPFSDASDELGEEEVQKLIKDLGRSLAIIHSTDLPVIHEFGWLVNRNGSVHLREEENWRKMFESMMEYRLDSLEDTVFQAYCGEVREFVEQHLELLEIVDKPSLIHDDFRPGNILVDKDEVSGILDWARASAADPEYDLINSIYHFSEEIDIEEDLIEKKFLSGYTEIRSLSENFESKKKLYMINAITGKMTGFATFWGENYSEEKQKEIEKGLVEDLEKILRD